jgi:hypothetical protein
MKKTLLVLLYSVSFSACRTSSFVTPGLGLIKPKRYDISPAKLDSAARIALGTTFVLLTPNITEEGFFAEQFSQPSIEEERRLYEPPPVLESVRGITLTTLATASLLTLSIAIIMSPEFRNLLASSALTPNNRGSDLTDIDDRSGRFLTDTRRSRIFRYRVTVEITTLDSNSSEVRTRFVKELLEQDIIIYREQLNNSHYEEIFYQRLEKELFK